MLSNDLLRLDDQSLVIRVMIMGSSDREVALLDPAGAILLLYF
jgi:hypothetical protein